MKLEAKQRLLATDSPEQQNPMMEGRQPEPQALQQQAQPGPQDKPVLEQSSFLPQQLVMIDCEMTGLNIPKDDIIQVAALKLQLKGNQYMIVDEPFNQFIHTDKEPESEFARTHMTEIYRKAQESKLNYQDIATLLKVWLGDWAGKVSPTGDCVSTDIMFLASKGVITTSYYDGDTPVEGTFFYEQFDLNPLKAVARTVAGSKFDKQLKRLPGDHDALIDCKNQAMELNAFLGLLLNAKAEMKTEEPPQKQAAPQPSQQAPKQARAPHQAPPPQQAPREKNDEARGQSPSKRVSD